MKNLQNFGVQELNAKEYSKINGGGFFTFFVIISALAGLMLYTKTKNTQNYIDSNTTSYGSGGGGGGDIML
jgi:hypothetical protein